MICAKHQSDGSSCFVNELLSSEQVRSKVWCRQLLRQGPTNNYTPGAPDILLAKPPTAVQSLMARWECETAYSLSGRKKKSLDRKLAIELQRLACQNVSSNSPCVLCLVHWGTCSTQQVHHKCSQASDSEFLSSPNYSTDRLSEPAELLTLTPDFSYRHLSHRAVVRNSRLPQCWGHVSPQ